MQYTATSFAEPLQRVFDDVLRPDTDIEITPIEESRYLALHVAYRARIVDAFEEWLYKPVIRAGRDVPPAVVRRVHTPDSVHLYLAYGALGVLIVLVVADERDVLSRRCRAALAVMAGAPLVIGVTRQVRAMLEGRAGGGVAAAVARLA